MGNLTATYTRLYAPVDGAFPDGLWREVIVRTVNLQNYLKRGFKPELPAGKVLEDTVAVPEVPSAPPMAEVVDVVPEVALPEALPVVSFDVETEPEIGDEGNPWREAALGSGVSSIRERSPKFDESV